MIHPDHPRLSIRRQCELVSVSRASFYRQPSGATPETLELMRVIDAAGWRGICGARDGASAARGFGG